MHDTTIGVRLSALPDLEELGRRWRQLETAARPAYFLSWAWIGTWLARRPPGPEPWLLVAEQAGRTVGLGIVTRGEARLPGGARVRRLLLNDSGDFDYNLNPEYNGLLVEPGLKRAVARAVLGCLADTVPRWDELRLHGLDLADPLADPALAREAGLAVEELWRQPVPRVNLEALRRDGRPFLETLSPSTRARLRRARRGYAPRGELVLDQAASREEAHEFFSGLKALHQVSWTRRGKPGSFHKRHWEPFHRALIDARFPAGEIQLLRLRAGRHVLGYLYNLVYEGHVHYIQSGLKQEADPHLKPGYLAHALAVEHNLALGHRIYDFLAGEARYKASLANEAGEMTWLRLHRPGPRARALELARRLRRNLHRLAGPVSAFYRGADSQASRRA